MNYLKFETREKTNKFLLDPVINEFNNQIIKIRNLRIPGTIVIEGGEPQVIYDEKTQALIEKFIEQRDKYIKKHYMVGGK